MNNRTKKTGILTFHYSNNFGGVLQCYSLYKYLKLNGHNVEIINYIPKKHKKSSIFSATGIRKAIWKSKKEDLNPFILSKRIMIKAKYNQKISNKFDCFRDKYMTLSDEVNEDNLNKILKNYDSIIVGSDQVWNPGRRKQKTYFIDFGDQYKGKKISYAADSTIAEVDRDDKDNLSRALYQFNYISVRNEHSKTFVENLIGDNLDTEIVCDPTLLVDFSEFDDLDKGFLYKDENYILVYVLGKEIEGSNRRLIEKIKEKYGDLNVYAITIPTMKFNVPKYADKVFYDLGPIEWLQLIKNATFVLTDSFHGTLFSLKFHKPFIAYYAEKMRSTRFIDIGKRYGIEKYIVNSLVELEKKSSLNELPDFESIDKKIREQKQISEAFLEKALK